LHIAYIFLQSVGTKITMLFLCTNWFVSLFCA